MWCNGSTRALGARSSSSSLGIPKNTGCRIPVVRTLREGVDGVQFSAARKTMKYQYVIGIDEVGRGPLAGPVTVAAVATTNLKSQISNLKNLKLRDSKKLSPRQREIWFKFIKENKKIYYAIASVSPKIIDRINISRAANLAATRALARLLANKKLATRDLKIFLDGGLHLNTKTLMPNGYWLNSKTLVKADEKIPAVSLASIVAKVTRDRRMKKLHKKFPQYDFINNVGYGTKKHIKAIKKYGLCKIHRRTFAKKFENK